MKKNMLIALCFAVFLSVFCFPLKKVEMKIFLTEKEDDENYQFYMARDCALDDKMNLYIVDAKGLFVKKYDENGKFVSSFGKKGNGPGELNSPRGIEYCEGKIFIPQSYRLDVFSTNGVFEKSFSYPPNFRLSWLKTINGKIGVLYGISGDKFELIAYSLDDPDKDVKKLASTKLSTYSTDKSRMAVAKDEIRFDVLKNDCVVFGYVNEAKVQKYSFKDNSLKTIISLNYTRKKIPEDMIKKVKEEYNKYLPGNEVEIPEYHWLMPQINTDDENNIWLYVQSNEKTGLMKFDPNGKFLSDYNLILPGSELEGYGWIHIKNNFIYSFRWTPDDGLNIYRGTLK